MDLRIEQVSLLVRDYDEAAAWFTSILGFIVVEDSRLSDTKRWVRLQPPGSGTTTILLSMANTAEQMQAVGNQAGGKVFLFLYTDDIERDHKQLKENNVKIEKPLSTMEYGKVLVFSDLYGNKWDLIERV